MKKTIIILVALISLINANASDFFGLNWGDEAFYSINKLRLNYGNFSSYNSEENEIYYFENDKMNIGGVELDIISFSFTPFFGKYYLSSFSAFGEYHNSLLEALDDAKKIYNAMQYSHNLEEKDFKLEHLTEGGLVFVYRGEVNRSNGISAIFSILISHENEDGINKYSVYCSGKTDDLTKFFSNK